MSAGLHGSSFVYTVVVAIAAYVDNQINEYCYYYYIQYMPSYDEDSSGFHAAVLINTELCCVTQCSIRTALVHSYSDF